MSRKCWHGRHFWGKAGKQLLLNQFLCWFRICCLPISLLMLCASYHQKTKWRPNGPEITVTRLICHLEMKFRRLNLCFRGLPTRWNSFQHGIHYPSTRNQDGGCETGSSCKSAYMPLRNEISTAIPMFSWSANTSEYLPTRNSLPFYQKSRWLLQNRK